MLTSSDSRSGPNVASCLGFVLHSLLFSKFDSDSDSHYPFVLASQKDFLTAASEVVAHLSRSQPLQVVDTLTKFLHDKKLEWISIHSVQSISNQLSPISRQMLLAVSLLRTCIKSSEFIFAPAFCAHGSASIFKSRVSLSKSLSIILQVGLNGFSHQNSLIRDECADLLMVTAHSLALLSVRCDTFSTLGTECKSILSAIEVELKRRDPELIINLEPNSSANLVHWLLKLLQVVSSSIEPNTTLALLSRSPSVASCRSASPSKRSLLELVERGIIDKILRDWKTSALQWSFCSQLPSSVQFNYAIHRQICTMLQHAIDYCSLMSQLERCAAGLPLHDTAVCESEPSILSFSSLQTVLSQPKDGLDSLKLHHMQECIHSLSVQLILINFQRLVNSPFLL